MKELFLSLILVVLVPFFLEAQTNFITLSGTYFKPDNVSINVLGFKVGYLSQATTNVFWGMFIEDGGGTQTTNSYSYMDSNYQIHWVPAKDETVTLLKLGTGVEIFPGNSKNLFVGCEAYYVSAKDQDIKTDGWGISPKVGMVFFEKSVGFILEAKYNIIRFTDEDTQTKGVGAEAGIIIPLN